jgi:hypothetical protein
MSTVSRGFRGRRRPSAELPPGQYLVEDFPVLSAGPTPDIDLADWELAITSETDEQRRWDWAGFRALPSEQVTVDLHCVTHWSKLGTTWEGVSLDTLLDRDLAIATLCRWLHGGRPDTADGHLVAAKSGTSAGLPPPNWQIPARSDSPAAGAAPPCPGVQGCPGLVRRGAASRPASD